ncbi:MAG: peptide chain release factor N(5)-glutamine methyltransferase [Gammaproteobacteria bacterium]|nr:MAG: peptide chain release factor N(5)-glutamine methyltransferase [Gammaproteobacteria bacterium]
MRLRGASDSARLDAELLLAHALGWRRVRLYGDATAAVRPEIAARFLRLVEERRAGRPVAQLLGEREFWSLSLKVTQDVLVPRPETEMLVECALRRLPPDDPGPVLDLGTGSGAIALALASERPVARIVATDFSEAALNVARYNAASLGCGQIDFRFGDWFRAAGDERFRLVVSNPPYLTDQEWLLRRYELGYEPSLALRGGRDGLLAIRRIVAEAPAQLAEGGWLLIEHGFRQGPAVARLFQDAGFEHIATYRDLPGRPRVTEGCWPADTA